MFAHFYAGGYSRAEFLKRKCYFKKIGDHCWLQPWNFGTEPNLISFGNNVHIASGVTFINHDITAQMLRYMYPEIEFKNRVESIIIDNNVFVGANSVVLYGVHIGSNVVIGAGSVVTGDIPDGVVACGIPCKPIGSFVNWKEKMKK